nr:MAG TPA: hypothetical protein [Caudoviricetes sp.]
MLTYNKEDIHLLCISYYTASGINNTTLPK